MDLSAINRVQAGAPGLGLPLSSLFDAIDAVSFPIAFDDIGVPGTASTRAIILMLIDRTGVPETVAASMLQIFRRSPYKKGGLSF